MRHHQVSVEGRTTDETGSNFPYSVLQLVRERLGEEDATLEDMVRLTGLVFPSSYEHYAARLRIYCTNAGFAESIKLTLHSFRAGFLTTAMLNNANQLRSLHDAWTNSAIVCAWNLSKNSSQFRYVKLAFQRCIVASRVLLGVAPEGVDVVRFGEGVSLGASLFVCSGVCQGVCVCFRVCACAC